MGTGKSDACKTYVDQTKLLVTLASGFIVAPAVVAGLMGGQTPLMSQLQTSRFVVMECLFIGSVLAGYLTIGSVAGSQDDESFDVFRPATRALSWAQLVSYLSGLGLFLQLVYRIPGH